MPRLWWMTLLVLLGCSPLGADGSHDEPLAGVEAGPAALEPAGAGTALALLGALPVREHGPRDGYGREQFGPPWADADRNGCETRDDILRRDLGDVEIKPGARACVVLSGTLEDPYTGRKIRFDRGGASEVDIDHVVALENAWVTGAAALSFRQRVALANDPLNLIAAEARANRAKGASDAARWLPPNPRFHCAYAARQIAVKAKYGLWTTPAEHAALAGALQRCPDEPAPASDAPTTAPIDPREPAPHTASARRPASEPGRTPATRVRPPAGEPGAAGTADAKRPADPRPSEPDSPAPRRTPDPDYGSCKQVKAHGAGPYVRGRDPEYAYYDDR
ncbi:MAG TPA: DUF1524 domain-containing protein, partial [Nannocystis sp.]